MDMDFGPDGSLYVIEWGSGFGGNNADSGIYRIDYVARGRRPIAHATATPDNGPAPLTVQFSSAGSIDPEGTALTYAWDFDGNGTTDSTARQPVPHLHDRRRLQRQAAVTDQSGPTGVDNVPIIGRQPRADGHDRVPRGRPVRRLRRHDPVQDLVTDPEDGRRIGHLCDDVTVNISLGHDEHAHDLSEQTGCEGTFQTASTAGHGAEANTFTVIEAAYTDKGGPGAAR